MEIRVAGESLDRFAELLSRAPDSWSWFRRRIETERHRLQHGFDRLLTTERLPALYLYPHQRTAVLRVLEGMRGRAILADEVGLGKTIEAGVVLKEYLLRGLVRTFLILTPATLTLQWQRELSEKLAIDAVVNRSPGGWSRHDGILASLDLAKRPEHAQQILQRPWDFVVVDEAHRLKDRSSQGWKFVNRIQRKYLLLLTATPIQNDLKELYNLVTLLRPGQLATYAQFRRAFAGQGRGRTARNVETLRELLRPVMVRTSRSETLLPFPRRRVEKVAVRPAPGEIEFLERLLAHLQEAYAALPPGNRNPLPFLVLLREAASHPSQAAETLRRVGRAATATSPFGDLRRLAELAEEAESIHCPAKLSALLAQVGRRDAPEALVVFTEFRSTQRCLCRELARAGHTVHALNGKLSAPGRQALVDRFRAEGGILVSTDAGGLGLNLQFCCRLVNYDLPWNPLRIEQRIGRLHRLGQRRVVEVANLILTGSLEEEIYQLLALKVRLFEEVVGGLDLLLEEPEGQGFERRVGEILLGARSRIALAEALAAYGARLAELRSRADRVYRLNRRLLDEVPAEGGPA